jgi:hypothetical protein
MDESLAPLASSYILGNAGPLLFVAGGKLELCRHSDQFRQ